MARSVAGPGVERARQEHVVGVVEPTRLVDTPGVEPVDDGEDEPRALLREKAGQGAERGGHHASATIMAQIPGRVVRLWVAEGDTVEAGQRLLAIEAMKMENEVRAHRAGTVESIRVAPDSSVELGDELLTVR